MVNKRDCVARLDEALTKTLNLPKQLIFLLVSVLLDL